MTIIQQRLIGPIMQSFMPRMPPNAALATKKISRSKHSSVLAAFRQYFVKTDIFSSELSDIYSQLMEDRHESDYGLITAISKEDAIIDLRQAKQFVESVEALLDKECWL